MSLICSFNLAHYTNPSKVVSGGLQQSGATSMGQKCRLPVCVGQLQRLHKLQTTNVRKAQFQLINSILHGHLYVGVAPQCPSAVTSLTLQNL